MKDEISSIPNCKEGVHFLKVWLITEKPKENSYYLGICLSCGLTETLSVKKIEEIFSNK